MGRVCLAGAFLLVTALLGATQAESRFALVIGNSNYGGDARLSNPANDATDVAGALEKIGWTVTLVLDADRREMFKGLQEVRDRLQTSPGSSALFYYAGHGMQIGGQNYLIPVRGTFETSDDVATDGFPLQAVQQAYDQAGANVGIYILDACRDNPFARKNGRSLGSERGLTVVDKSNAVEGSAILFATAPGEIAADGNGRNGVFTQALLNYLTTDLKLQDIVTRVTKDVKLVSGGKQTPYNSMSLSEDYYLVPASLRTALETQTVVVPRYIAQSNPIASRSKSDISSMISWAGAGLTLVGGGTAGFAYWQAQQSLVEYRAGTTQAAWDAAQNKGYLMNQIYPIALGVATSGLVGLVISWVLP